MKIFKITIRRKLLVGLSLDLEGTQRDGEVLYCSCKIQPIVSSWTEAHRSMKQQIHLNFHVKAFPSVIISGQIMLHGKSGHFPDWRLCEVCSAGMCWSRKKWESKGGEMKLKMIQTTCIERANKCRSAFAFTILPTQTFSLTLVLVLLVFLVWHWSLGVYI